MSKGQTIADAFLSWRDYLARMVSRIVPPHDIEDIVQETYVRACQFQLQAKAEIKSPGALMTTIARNLALDHIKRADRRLTACLDEEIETDVGELHGLTDEPFHHVATAEEFAHFCEAVRHLPLQCRKVFILKKIYGYSQRDIARKLSLSENTVEKHIARGFKQCVQYMRQRRQAPRSIASVHGLPRPAAKEGGRR